MLQIILIESSCVSLRAIFSKYDTGDFLCESYLVKFLRIRFPFPFPFRLQRFRIVLREVYGRLVFNRNETSCTACLFNLILSAKRARTVLAISEITYKYY